jgi:hypothetical protein
MKLIHLIIGLLFCGFANTALAQNVPTRKPARQGYQTREQQEQNKNTQVAQTKRNALEADSDEYKSVFSFGLNTNTNSSLLGGFVLRKEILVNNGKAQKQYHYIGLELINVNSPREIDVTTNNGTLIYEKENYLFSVRPQYGRTFNVFKRSSEGGVQMNVIFAGGPTLGLLKPYYVQLRQRSGGSTIEVPYGDSDSFTTNNNYRIIAPGSFFSGFDNLSATLGVHAKLATSIELDAFRNSNISLELGVLAEYFPDAPKIIKVGENPNMWSSVYLTLFFGSKK